MPEYNKPNEQKEDAKGLIHLASSEYSIQLSGIVKHSPLYNVILVLVRLIAGCITVTSHFSEKILAEMIFKIWKSKRDV